jgi:hypothetical protein
MQLLKNHFAFHPCKANAPPVLEVFALQNVLPLPKIIQKALAHEELFIKALFERPQSLSALLPYDDYRPDHQVFLGKDGSLGAVFEIDLVEHEPLTGRDVIDTVSSLKSWLSLPEDYSLQIVFDQKRISSFDLRFEDLSKAYADGHPISKVLFNERLSRIQSACQGPDVTAPMERKAYLSLRRHSQTSTAKYRTMLAKAEKTLFFETKEFISDLVAFKHVVADLQHASKICLRPINASDLVDILRRFFNPKTYYKREFAKYNPNLSISEQVIFNAPTLDYSGITREGVKTRTISLKTSPLFAYPGGMSYFTKLTFPYRLSLSFSFPAKAKIKQFFDIKEFFLQNTPSARARRQREEVLEVQERLARDDRCLFMTFNVIVDGESDEELDRKTRDIVSIFHNDLECEVITESDIGLGLCLNSLPLCYSPKSDLSAQRFIRILRSDAVNFLAVFDSFRGLEKPLQLYLSRENNLVKFSLLENETSNHTIVLADSGSGKSAFVIDCVQAMKRMTHEPLVFVLDNKSSYLMLSEYFDADLTVFDFDRDVPFSPFRGKFDEGKVAFLTHLISAAIKLTSPTFELESDHTSAITKALKNAYAKKIEQAGLVYENGALKKIDSETEVELTMDDVVAELASLPSLREYESFETLIIELTQKLKPFYGDGAYSRFFKGSPSAQGKSKLFFVYDLDALDADPVLRTLMAMSVMDEITRIIKLPEHKGRMGLIVLEELGRLGKDATVARYVIDWAETLRKLGYWLIGLTPRPENYFEMEAGRALWSVADNFVFLQMSADNVRYLVEKSDILDEASAEIVKSLRTVRSKYADVFFTNKKKTRQGAFRFSQTPLDRWLAPTNARDALAASEAKRRYPGDKWKALEHLAALYPEGIS